MDWPHFDGELLEGPEAAPYADDFGGLVHSPPRAVLRAATVDDVVAAVRFARGRGLGVVARGQGHTTRGQSLGRGGLVVDLRGLARIDQSVDDTVWVQAGARWTHVVNETFASGWTPRVLTDYLDLTVGGTLSVGGVGGQSFRNGLQVDNVVELDVVTGEGELVRCSAKREPDVFDACRGGLGRFGIIVAARLRVERAPALVRVRHLPFGDLEAFVAGQFALARSGAFEYLVGNLVPTAVASQWTLSVECVEYLDGRRSADDRLEPFDLAASPAETLPFLGYVHRLDAMVRAWQASGSWTALHPWIDLFVTREAATSIIGCGLEDLDADGLGEGYVMTYPLLRASSRAVQPGLPDADELFLFDILPTIRRDRPDRLAAMQARCARLFAAAAARGSTVYPIGYPLGTEAMDGAAWRRQFGAHEARLNRTRARLDPDGVFAKG